jgi:hypothetical protein
MFRLPVAKCSSIHFKKTLARVTSYHAMKANNESITIAAYLNDRVQILQQTFTTSYVVFTVHFDNTQQLNQQMHFIS